MAWDQDDYKMLELGIEHLTQAVDGVAATQPDFDFHRDLINALHSIAEGLQGIELHLSRLAPYAEDRAATD